MVGARISGLVHALGWLVPVAVLRSPHAANAHATATRSGNVTYVMLLSYAVGLSTLLCTMSISKIPAMSSDNRRARQDSWGLASATQWPLGDGACRTPSKSWRPACTVS